MWVDGVEGPATISVHDLTVIRGDGAFEVISLIPSSKDKSVGVPFGQQPHLDRLKWTCDNLRLPLKCGFDSIDKWVRDIGRTKGPGSCRIIHTRGEAKKGVDPKVIMLHDPPATYSPIKLKTIQATWHLGYSLPALEKGQGSEKDIGLWTTIKWMSYAPNCLMTRMANEAGADDALLLAKDGRVLDGPNFAVGFVIEGKIRFVSGPMNRMLPSCTQGLVVQAAQADGLPHEETVVHSTEMSKATAGFAMSATRHVLPLTAIDEVKLNTEDPLLKQLQQSYWKLADAASAA